MKKKVLIISYSYPPSNVPAAQRPYAVAKYLNKDNFEVTVITCGNPDPSWGTNEGFDSSLQDVNVIKINSWLSPNVTAMRNVNTPKSPTWISRIKAFVFEKMATLIVPDQAIFWVPKVSSYLKQNKDLTDSIDIVYTTSPAFSNHLIGRLLKSKNRNMRWVSELRDFHFIETVKSATSLKSIINKKLEADIIRKSDKVSFISYAMCEIYAKAFQNYKNKFDVVYNGFDVSDFNAIKIDKTRNEKLTIFYAGSFYKGVRSPGPLLKILDKMIEEKKISSSDFVIQIAGRMENEIIDEVRNFVSSSSIEFLGIISRTEALQRMANADLLWMIVGSKPTHYTGIPIKFFEYLAVRRPIINFAPSCSEPTRIITERNLGWNFHTDDFDLLDSAKLFQKIIIAYKSDSLSIPLPKIDYPEFNRSDQAEKFASLFTEDF